MNHVVTRSVRDSALLLDATQGEEVGSLFRIAPPERSYLSELESDPKPLRIAFSTTSPIGTEVDPEAVAAVEDAARLLESLGHKVEQASPKMDMLAMSMDWLSMWFANCAASVDWVREETGCGNDGFELDTLAMAAFGHATSAPDYMRGYQRWQGYSRALAEFHQQYDLWLTPTLALQPARIGASETPAWQQRMLKVILKVGAEKLVMKTGLVEQMVKENLKYVPFTQLANVTGVPAMSVPLHWCESGLPLGVQLVGDHGSEGPAVQTGRSAGAGAAPGSTVCRICNRAQAPSPWGRGGHQAWMRCSDTAARSPNCSSTNSLCVGRKNS